MTRLAGKTREQIERACARKSRSELIDVIYAQATLENLVTASEIAARSGINKRDVLRDMNDGKFVDPVLGAGFFTRGGNSKKVSASAANVWRASFFVRAPINGGSL